MITDIRGRKPDLGKQREAARLGANRRTGGVAQADLQPHAPHARGQVVEHRQRVSVRPSRAARGAPASRGCSRKGGASETVRLCRPWAQIARWAQSAL
jgi:hypothetical protein